MRRKNDADDLRARVERLEHQVALLTRLVNGAEATVGDNYDVLLSLTPKMHAALQMLMRGASNREIAERFGVRESTAKIYVRGIMNKLGVRDRHEVAAAARRMLGSLSDDEYLRIARVPRNWDADFDKVGKKYKSILIKTR